MGKPVEPPKLAALLEDKAKFEEHWTAFVHRYASWLEAAEIRVDPKDPWEEDFGKFKKNKTHGTLGQEEDLGPVQDGSASGSETFKAETEDNVQKLQTTST